MKNQGFVMANLMRHGSLSQTTENLFSPVSTVIEAAHISVSRQVNSVLVLMNWHVGQLISAAVFGENRADYGKQIVATLPQQLVGRVGRRAAATNLTRMTVLTAKSFVEISATPSHQMVGHYGRIPDGQIVATLERQLRKSNERMEPST